MSLLLPLPAMVSEKIRSMSTWMNFGENVAFVPVAGVSILLVARSLLPDAMESDRPLPLIEAALERLRTKGILAPNMIHIERLVWIVLKIAERRLLRTLTQSLTLEQRTRLDGLLSCGYQHSWRDAPELVTAGSWRDFSQKYQAIGRAPVISAGTVASCAASRRCTRIEFCNWHANAANIKPNHC